MTGARITSANGTATPISSSAPPSDLRPENQKEHVVRRDQRAEECARGRSWRRIRHEMQEAVQTEDKEHQAQENASDDNYDPHLHFLRRY